MKMEKIYMLYITEMNGMEYYTKTPDNNIK